MNGRLDNLLVCPYCECSLHSAPNRWFSRDVLACEQCGDFPDFGGSLPLVSVRGPAHEVGPMVAKNPHRPWILLVDDSAEHRHLYALMLEPTASVAVASRGDDGLALAYADPPDVIVLDVLMPGMDGWEVGERLKANPITTASPIIMLTSLDGADVPGRARHAGAIAVLMKPCPVERLVLALQATVRRPAAH